MGVSPYKPSIFGRSPHGHGTPYITSLGFVARSDQVVLDMEDTKVKAGQDHHGVLWGIPNSWMVYFMENPIHKWMRTGGTPILGNLYMRLETGFRRG